MHRAVHCSRGYYISTSQQGSSSTISERPLLEPSSSYRSIQHYASGKNNLEATNCLAQLAAALLVHYIVWCWWIGLTLHICTGQAGRLAGCLDGLPASLHRCEQVNLFLFMIRVSFVLPLCFCDQAPSRPHQVVVTLEDRRGSP